jgi:hypothetical protein
MPIARTKVNGTPKRSKNWLVAVSVIFNTTPTVVATTQARMPPGLKAGIRPGRNSTAPSAIFERCR